MRLYRIGDRLLEEGSSEFQAFLPRAYERKLRPLCCCTEPPVPMYITRLDGQFLVKRMPLSGRDHDPVCASYEPPYDLSGLGPLVGNAIQIDGNGRTALKLDFSLSKRGPRAVQSTRSEAAESAVGKETKKLSLRAMLHYLWKAGELTEWHSSWAGKRGWSQVRARLMGAALQMTARGRPVSEMLFVPETFHAHDKEAIASRRAAALAVAQASGSGPRELMIGVAEVKEFASARTGCKIMLRHLPIPFMIEESAWKRLTSRYEIELELWRSNEDFHLVLIATFGISAAGVAAVEDVALMVVNENWLPFENAHELYLLEKLAGSRRKIIKGLRFNLSRDHPIVSVILPEQRSPVAMFIVPTAASEDYRQALAEIIASRPEVTPWIWQAGKGDMPRLP